MVKPLTLEVKVLDELIQRLKSIHDTNMRELKMLNTVIRIPKLCQDFQMALRQRYEADRIKKMQKQAIA